MKLSILCEVLFKSKHILSIAFDKFTFKVNEYFKKLSVEFSSF